MLVDTVFTYFDTILCFLGIALNCLLIHCVRTRSPQAIAAYSFLLFNCAISDLITCWVTLFVQPRILTSLDNIYYVTNGFCKYFGAPICFLGYGVMVNLYGHLTVSQLASFIYRLYILHHSVPTRKQMLIVVLLVCIPTVFSFFVGSLPFIISHWNETYKKEISQIHPELDVQALTTFGVPHDINDKNAAIPTMWILIPIFPVTITVFIIRSRILKFLSRQQMLSDQVKRMHKNLLKALTLQAMLSPLYILGISLFMADVALGLHHWALEYGLYTICSIIPILSPIFPLYFVSPYHKFVVSLFTSIPETKVSISALSSPNQRATN